MKEAQEIYEEKLAEIEDAFSPDPDTGSIKPKKQVKTIKPVSLKQKAYFDTEEDVDIYIKKLKNELMEAIRNSMRVRIE